MTEGLYVASRKGLVPIRRRNRGWEAGALGYPISDEYAVAGGRRGDFEGGSLVWTAATDQISEVP